MASTEVSSTDAGAAGAVTHEVLCTGMHGRVKADDNSVGANVGTHELCGAGDRCRRRVVRMWEFMEMGKSGCA